MRYATIRKFELSSHFSRGGEKNWEDKIEHHRGCAMSLLCHRNQKQVLEIYENGVTRDAGMASKIASSNPIQKRSG